MNFFAATKLTTFAIVLGLLSIVYMPQNKSIDITLPTVEYSNAGNLDASEPNSSGPEPATMLLFGTGLAGFAGVIRRKKK